MTSIDYTESLYPDSTVIGALWRNEQDQSVLVAFLHGTAFRYNDVPYDVWTEWRDSRSVGSYYNSVIRGLYTSEYIGENHDITMNFVGNIVPKDVPAVYRFVGQVYQTISETVEVSAGQDSFDRAVAAFVAAHPGVKITTFSGA